MNPNLPKWPGLQPQPTTPIRGKLVLFTFEEVRRARRSAKAGKKRQAAGTVAKTFRRARALDGSPMKFGLKPHRNSRGIVWQSRAFYWSEKGYYRGGKGDRRPLQHLIWEESKGKKIPAKHEILFRDGDRHNFRPSNLRCLHKAEVHRMCIDRGMIVNKFVKNAPERLGLMLKRFGSNKTNGKESKNEHSDTIKFLGERRQRYHPQAARH